MVNNPQLSGHWRAKIALVITDLVINLHEHYNIIHGDLKPDNIVLRGVEGGL
jgi:hypothetical protein